MKLTTNSLKVYLDSVKEIHNTIKSMGFTCISIREHSIGLDVTPEIFQDLADRLRVNVKTLSKVSFFTHNGIDWYNDNANHYDEDITDAMAKRLEDIESYTANCFYFDNMCTKLKFTHNNIYISIVSLEYNLNEILSIYSAVLAKDPKNNIFDFEDDDRRWHIEVM